MSVKDNFSVAATLSQLRYLVFQGMKGDTGDSAYEEAVKLGFVGTEEEWIASLKGETGANGRDGQDGAPGTPGRDGVSPTVQTEAITGGHRVTITDKAHPQGQSFDLLDGKVEGTVRFDETQTLTDAQKNTACGNIGALGQLEYDAIQQSLSALDADISLKADEADLPTKVSDLENDTGYITASQVPAAPVQSVNGRTGSVTVNEVPEVGGTDNKKVLTANNGSYTWAAVPTGETTKRISLYKDSQTGVYTCSMSATQLHEALPNVVLATEDYRVPVSAYSIDKDDSYVKAVFIDDRPENNAAIVWTLSAASASASEVVAVTREECSIEGLPDYSHAIDGQVLTKAQDGPRWANNNPSSGAALRLLYDGAFGPDDPDLMLMGNVADAETGNAIATALYYGRIGSAVLVDVTDSNTEVVYDLFAVDYDAQTHVSTVTFARPEADCIRTATLSGSTKSAPTFGTLPLSDGGSPFEIPITSDGQGNYTTTATAQEIYDNAENCVIVFGIYRYALTRVQKDTSNESTNILVNFAADINSALHVAEIRIHAELPSTVTIALQDSGFFTLPAVTSGDNGKFLRVVSGAWAAESVPFQTPRVAMISTDTTPTLDPNKLYVFPEMASLAITLATPTDATIVNEYHFIFTSGATATTLSIPATVNQPDGFSVDANMVYEVSILEGCMTAMSWEVSS